MSLVSNSVCRARTSGRIPDQTRHLAQTNHYSGASGNQARSVPERRCPAAGPTHSSIRPETSSIAPLNPCLEVLVASPSTVSSRPFQDLQRFRRGQSHEPIEGLSPDLRVRVSEGFAQEGDRRLRPELPRNLHEQRPETRIGLGPISFHQAGNNGFAEVDQALEGGLTIPCARQVEVRLDGQHCWAFSCRVVAVRTGSGIVCRNTTLRRTRRRGNRIYPLSGLPQGAGPLPEAARGTPPPSHPPKYHTPLMQQKTRPSNVHQPPIHTTRKTTHPPPLPSHNTPNTHPPPPPTSSSHPSHPPPTPLSQSGVPFSARRASRTGDPGPPSHA